MDLNQHNLNIIELWNKSIGCWNSFYSQYANDLNHQGFLYHFDIDELLNSIETVDNAIINDSSHFDTSLFRDVRYWLDHFYVTLAFNFDYFEPKYITDFQLFRLYFFTMLGYLEPDMRSWNW